MHSHAHTNTRTHKYSHTHSHAHVHTHTHSHAHLATVINTHMLNNRFLIETLAINAANVNKRQVWEDNNE